MFKKLLIAIATLVTMAGIVLTINAWSASRNWQRCVSDLRATGEPLTFADIQSRRTPTLTKDRTIADVVASVANKVKMSPGPISRGVLGMSNSLQINFFTGIPRDAIDITRRYMAPRRVAFADIDTIHDLEPGRFNISYNVPPLDLMTRFIVTSPPIQRLTQILYLDATLKLIDGNTESAAAIIPILFDVVSPLTEEPSDIAHLRHISTAESAVRILENALRVGTLSRETLKTLDDTLTEYLRSYSIKWALWSERAIHIAMFDPIRSAVGIPGASLFIATYADQQRGTEMLGWLIEAGDDPAKLLAARNRIDSELSTLSKTKMMTSTNLVTIPMSVTLHLRCLAEIRAARIAIAAERFRLSESEFPASLDVLVPEYLQEVPVDPFDQTHMKLVKHDGGMVIYSVGSDGIDNNGNVAPIDGEKRPRDYGFRLLAESNRGLVLVEIPSDDGG